MKHRVSLAVFLLSCGICLSSCSQDNFAIGTDANGQPYIVSKGCVERGAKFVRIIDHVTGTILWEARPINMNRKKIRVFRFASSIPGWTVSGKLPPPGAKVYMHNGLGQRDWVLSKMPNTFSEYQQTFASYTKNDPICAGLLGSPSSASSSQSSPVPSSKP